MKKAGKFLIYIVTISILFHHLKYNFLVYEYILDNKDFTEKYCENKDKPTLHCNGKCAVKKMISISNPFDKTSISSYEQTIKLDNIFFDEPFVLNFKNNNSYFNTEKISDLISLEYLHQDSKTFFHPPKNYFS